MTMHNPPHPGELFKAQLIEDEDGNRLASVSDVAKKLGCTRNTVNELIRCNRALSVKMAVALERQGPRIC